MKRSWIIILTFVLTVLGTIVLINERRANPDQRPNVAAVRGPLINKVAFLRKTLFSDVAGKAREFLFFPENRIIPADDSPAVVIESDAVPLKTAAQRADFIAATLAERTGRASTVFIGQNSALAAGETSLCFLHSPLDAPVSSRFVPRLPFSPYHHSDDRPYYLANAVDYDLTTSLSAPLALASEGRALKLDGCFPGAARQVWILSRGPS